MKKLVFLIFLFGCITQEEIIERMSGTPHLVISSYGERFAVLWDYQYYYVVSSSKNLRRGQRVDLVPSFEAYISEPNVAFVDRNYFNKVKVHVIYKTWDEDEAIDKLDKITLEWRRQYY